MLVQYHFTLRIVSRRLSRMTETRVQRRLAAILAADVVGFSRLMGKDEAGTLHNL